MSPSDVSYLARRLQEDGHTELAMRFGLAVDTNRRVLPLSLEDRELILTSLDGCPDALRPLRAKLKNGQALWPNGGDRRVPAERRNGPESPAVIAGGGEHSISTSGVRGLLLEADVGESCSGCAFTKVEAEALARAGVAGWCLPVELVVAVSEVLEG
jgi:hypothetical protein